MRPWYEWNVSLCLFLPLPPRVNDYALTPSDTHKTHPIQSMLFTYLSPTKTLTFKKMVDSLSSSKGAPSGSGRYNLERISLVPLCELLWHPDNELYKNTLHRGIQWSGWHLQWTFKTHPAVIQQLGPFCGNQQSQLVYCGYCSPC